MASLTTESLLKIYSEKLLDACTNDKETIDVQALLLKLAKVINSKAQLKRILLNFSKDTSSELRKLAFDFFIDINELPKLVLQVKATEYFEQRYPGSSVVFSEKLNGVQLGSIAEVTSIIGKKIRFYIKTHRKGLLSQFSSTAKPVDLTEIFLYKFLEKIGFGPEVHFFYSNPEEFYICTRDAGDIDSQSNMSFMTFSNFIDSDATKQIVERVRSMDPCNETIDYDTDKFMLAIVEIDILCRLFDMHDVLKNADNFGFILNSNRIERFSIIDFSPTSYGLCGDEIYKGFIEGNGVFLHHRNNEPALKYILCSRSIDKRRELGQRAFQQMGDLRIHVITIFEFLKLLVQNDEELSAQLLGIERKTQNWLQAIDQFRELLQK